MRRLLLALVSAAALGVAALAQNPSAIQITGVVPTGSCSSSQIWLLIPNGTIYTCVNGTPTASGGSGTVTSVSVGNLSPVFTASVATATTTPAISFALSNAAGYSWFGNSASTSGAPAYNTSALPISLIPTTLVAQKFFGTAAPGSVAGNLPGDLFSDTTNHNDYWCAAVSGTAAPACTSVTAGGWTLLNGGGGSSAGLYVCASASGSGTAYTCTGSPTVSSLTARLTIAFKADVANTGAATLNVSTLGAKNIYKQCGSTPLIQNDLTAGAWVTLVYDGTEWQMQNAPCPNTDILSSAKPAGTTQSATGKNVVVTAGSTVDLLPLVSGQSGYVSEIAIFSNQNAEEIKVIVDGEGTPAIDATIANLLGDAYLDTQARYATPWIVGTNDGTNNPGGAFKIPVPFSSSIHITLTNNSASSATLTYHVIYHTGVPDTWPNEQKLWMAVENTSGIAANAETNMVNVSSIKPGRLVGLGWIEDSYPGSASPATAPLEGAFKVYLDGNASPNFQTSGSEDMIGEGWYFNGFNTFGYNTTMAPASDTTALTILSPVSAVTWGLLRFFIYDPITFNNALRFTWTCGNTTAVSFTGTCALWSTVWYYTAK